MAFAFGSSKQDWRGVYFNDNLPVGLKILKAIETLVAVALSWQLPWPFRRKSRFVARG
jgi:hypothetical protein